METDPVTGARRGEQGFSLLEILAAMTVTLIGLAGLMSVYTSAASGSVAARALNDAMDICEETMEGLRGMSVARIEARIEYGPITGAGWGPVAHHEGSLEGASGIVVRRFVEAAEVAGSTNLVWTRVSCEWTERGATPGADDGRYDHRVTLEMLRSRQETF